MLYVALPAATTSVNTANTNAGIKPTYPFETLFINNLNNDGTVYVDIDGVYYSVPAHRQPNILVRFLWAMALHSVSITSSELSFSFNDNLGNSGSTYTGEIDYTISGAVIYYKTDIRQVE